MALSAMRTPMTRIARLTTNVPGAVMSGVNVSAMNDPIRPPLRPSRYPAPTMTAITPSRPTNATVTPSSVQPQPARRPTRST